MRFVVAAALVACNAGPYPTYDPPRPPQPWETPPGWRHELIEFPLEFAPSIAHDGVEEIRFAPKFFDATAPGYWSYAFVWRMKSWPTFETDVIEKELVTYFSGLVEAVDSSLDRSSIAVHATHDHAHLAVRAHVIDPFTTKKPVDLVGTAKQIACPPGAVWKFTFAPVGSPMRKDIETLAAHATCGQVLVPNDPKK